LTGKGGSFIPFGLKKGGSMQVRKIDYYDGDTLLEATVASEEGNEKKPIVFIFHAWGGKGKFVEDKAVELAKLGFVGCALDIYGKGILEEEKEKCAALMTPFMEDRSKLQKRILACKSLFKSVPEADSTKIAVIGYCFGGLAALDFARSGEDVKGVVSFHGLLIPSTVLPKAEIKSKVLVFHGHKDPMVPTEDVLGFMQEMDEQKVDSQFHVFGNALHAFTNKDANDPEFGTVYNADADLRSWKQACLFFKEIFE
jgi:dienelactone hydrolase